MRGAIVFSGSSHPALVDGICDRLGSRKGEASLGKFANGETSVSIHTSIRDKDVFILQSGSEKINDAVMELLIMVSACKGGSAKSITAVMPYFPYSRQSKKKSHRGAITARMVANLLHIAGVNHVITIDLHATQMQGFFKCPVDNLIAEPLLARWIRVNVPNWKEAVAVSKNPGGTKRVTSLADALKLSFGIVTTDRRRVATSVWNESAMFEQLRLDGTYETPGLVEAALDADTHITPISTISHAYNPKAEVGKPTLRTRAPSNPLQRRANGTGETLGSPLVKSVRVTSVTEPEVPLDKIREAAPAEGEAGEAATDDKDYSEDEYTDERARDVIHGRLVQGHIVDEDHPSPAMSAVSNSTWRNRPPSDHDDDEDVQVPEHMLSSFVSTASSLRRTGTSEHAHALGGTYDAAASSEDEEEDLKNPELETMVTLVGNVKDRPVFIVDDMIDKSASWIAAAETVVKRGGATKVYCMATHGLFGGDCLEEMVNCACIEKIVVTNAFPIPPHKLAQAGDKLVVIGVDNLLAEAIRRNHHGESISQLFMHYD
ncbi:phosphoribosyl pyrophosphokinase [Aaosphaeria arxii CBS 175.79]|uniref:Ribose-phosphate pyrophosphokinase 1 n=1 Tax=Aaosphaeria arxii CBS 175.79 TaxID=1450172 RepID=A0A6A5XYI4_9PLEO|nr:phosphoribosyl pyrophosphokinase [Aaosphaeria arxii CBS 175.79]KAF2017993.1 phosphoribosyl pyrophosphokinase [Aaosphaeria arxii CBS 175.79]